MKKSTHLFLLACLTLLSLIPAKVKANHCAGAEIEYEWMHDSTYRLYYKFYRACEGGPAAPVDVTVCYHNSCNAQQYSIILQPVVGLLPPPNPRGLNQGDDISSICPGSGVQSSCLNPASNLPGNEIYWYTGVVTLPMRC